MHKQYPSFFVVAPSFIASWFCRICEQKLMNLTLYQSEALEFPPRFHISVSFQMFCVELKLPGFGVVHSGLCWLLVVFAALIVISLVFIASWAFSLTSMCVNLLRFSTFHWSFCFHAAQYFHSVEWDTWSDSMWVMWFYNSKILLPCIAQDQTGAKFFNIPDNEIVPVLT